MQDGQCFNTKVEALDDGIVARIEDTAALDNSSGGGSSCLGDDCEDSMVAGIVTFGLVNVVAGES